MEKEYHNISETSELSGISVYHINKMIHDHQVPVFKCGKKNMIHYGTFMDCVKQLSKM